MISGFFWRPTVREVFQIREIERGKIRLINQLLQHCWDDERVGNFLVLHRREPLSGFKLSFVSYI
jgi:hypothetical protein